MSLTKDVADVIARRGSATLDEVWSDLPHYTRRQIEDAMKNARSAGLIHCGSLPSRKGRGKGGSLPAPHYPGPKPRYASERVIYTRPPNSAWELGQGRQIAGAWPPLSAEGRKCHPLGGWAD